MASGQLCYIRGPISVLYVDSAGCLVAKVDGSEAQFIIGRLLVDSLQNTATSTHQKPWEQHRAGWRPDASAL